MIEQPIVAVDVENADKAAELLAKLPQEPLFLKIGMELFYQAGPAFVKDLKEQGHRIFLDLKLHDIPHTVEKAAFQIAALEVDLFTVHAAGGQAMMEAAVLGAGRGSHTPPVCLAVTQLTSTTEEVMQEDLLINSSLADAVRHFSGLAARAGAGGVICSAWEAAAVRQEQSPDFMAVTPGIRMKGDDIGDQKRVADPAEAREMGSSAIVVGRSITGAADPAAAYKTIEKTWRNA
ncbi:orotidine-5'-phosphate decarboxylase [Sinobaca sp. H24]|uniref:orotidine-5'-phosphate decarboxylase n=1 Tax=Sinobaca sp. H24 TaxID=2923376 RepID=UPI00207A26C5|nr:orotidine-5'-phosphate decarboxylase [Sinobaca sp. H24]